MAADVVPRARLLDLNRVPLTLRLGSFTADIMSWGHIESGWWRNYLHTHSFFEICFAFAGRGVFRMRGVDHPLRAGEVFIAKPGEEHEIISSTDAPLGIWFWSFTLVPGTLAPARDGAHRDQTVDRLLHAFADSSRCVSARVPGMKRTIELMIEEVTRAEPGHAEILEGLARKLLLDTARASLEAPLAAQPLPALRRQDAAATVEMAKRYVRDNLPRQLAVRDIAAQVGLSERHFTRLFQQTAGQSPLAFVIEARIAAAEQLLLDPALSIKEVALRVGYPDVRYFTTAFGRQTGYPPATWRLGRGTSFTAPTGKDRGMRGFSTAGKALRKLRKAMDERALRNRHRDRHRDRGTKGHQPHGRKTKLRGARSK